MKTKFKKGDWCFCEFQLQQIKDMDGDIVTSVTDGFMNLSGSDLSDRCYPMDLTIKVISDDVNYWSKQFHSLKNNALNYPDLNRELIQRWIDLCDAKNDAKKLNKLYADLNEFGKNVVRAVENLRTEQIDGVKLFR